MKGISRFAAFIFILFTLLLPLTALAAAPQDMSISVQWKDVVGGEHLSDPAVPLTDAPDETRFWITLPFGAPTTGLTLNISDLTGGYASFLPNQGDELVDVYDALGTLNFPPVQIKCFNAEGELQAVYSLYLSSLPMPEIRATEAPAPVSAQVTVHYVDENGMTLRSDVVYNFDGGTHQITAADIDQYTVTGAADYTVTVDGSGAWPNEVTFTYTRVIPAAPVTIHYVDENRQSLLPDKVEMVPGGTQMVYAESISGYALAGPEALPVTVTMEGATPSEITFMYALQAQPVEIAVHYVDVNGNPLAADTVKTVQPGSNIVYPEASISPDQYLLTGAPYYEVYVTAQGANPSEVTFTYQRVAQAALVTIHYVDDQGTPIAADDYRTLEPGIHQLSPEAVLPADEYTLISPESVAVIVDVNGASQQEVTFTYQRQVRPVTVILHYVDDRGETIAQDSVLTYGAGEYIITPAATIASNLYILREPSAYSLNVNLDSAPINEVTFTYDRAVQPATVTVYYTDSQGNPVADATQQVFQGGSFAIFAQPQNLKPNYTLPADDPGFRNVTVDVDGAHPDTVTFVYEYNAPAPWTVSVLYVDAESGLYVATAQTVELGAGQATPISAQPVDLLPDYTLVSEPIVYVSVDAFGQGDVNEVVFRYQYVEPTPVPTEAPTPEPTEAPTPVPTVEPTEEPTPVPTAEPTEEPTPAPTVEPTEEPTEAPTEEPGAKFALVTVRYLDQAGNAVASDAQFVCAYGDTRILADPVDLQPGYELQGADSVIVHVDENVVSPAVVVFTYAYPVADVPAPKVALVNVKYVDPDGNVFYSSPVTCAEGQENPVSVDWNLVDASLGYKLASDETVYVTVDSAGAASPSEVIFKFSIELVTVRYVDMLTGLDVASAQQQQCYVGANLIDARPYDLLPGYLLYGEATAVVTLTASGELTPAEVVFQYIFQATATPEPVPPAYDMPMDAYFYPTGSSVRIRSTPTTAENNIIGSANSGDLGHALGYLITADNKVWYAVEINGIMGYMSDTVVRFLSEQEAAALFGYTLPPTEAPTPAPTAIPDGAVIDCWAMTTTKVNFRRSTSRSSDPIDSLKKNTRVWVYSSSTVNGEKWYAVRVNGTDGYLMADYVQVYTAEESAAIQAQLASPMPTQIPTETPTPVPTPPPTEAPTEIPTEAPTEAPTEIPTAEPTETPEPTPGPTETPAPYRGYALTNGQAALRTGVSQTDDTILQMLPDQSLMIVNGQTYVEGVPWASAQAVGSGNLGFILQSSLTPISAEEARPYLEQIQATPAATSTPVPEQTTGYAMTLGDGVPMRNFPDTNGEILMLLPYMAVANVRGQQYAGGDAWHLVQYNGMWGYIRQDQLRMMSAEEVQAYEQNLTAGTPTPTAAPTPEPVTQESLSSYGHVQSASGRVNLRSEPTTKNNNAIRLLDNYAFALVLGTVTNEEGTWYHVSQGGNEGYIRGDYFHVLALGELSEFLQSSEYLNANSNNTSTSATSSQIQPVEDYNKTVWQNPALTASYEPFNPYTTPTPDPERLYTATPVPTQPPTPSPTPEIAPVGPQGNAALEPNVQEGSSPWPWVLAGLAILCGGAAYGYYVHNQNEKRKRQMRETQARQARGAAAQRPQMRAARNNPTQGAGRAAYPSQNAGAYMPPQSSASRPASMPNQPSPDGVRPYQVRPSESETYQSVRTETQNYPPVRSETQKYQRQQVQSNRPAETGGSFYTASGAAGVQNAGSAPLTQNPQAAWPQTPVSNGQGLYQDMNAAGTIPEEASAQSDMGNTKRIRRTDRNKAKYDGGSDNNQNA